MGSLVITLRVRNNVCSTDFLYSMLYASPHISSRSMLWDYLYLFALSVEGPWLLVGDVNSILDASKRVGGSMVVRRDWNKRVYGNIFKHKKKLTAELKCVQRVLELRSSDRLCRKELELRQEIDELYWDMVGLSVWSMVLQVLEWPNIADNIAISQEAIHCLKKFKGKMFGMALKIYLEKAYERVWWKPLRLSRSRLALTHLFFADDLFLFGEADRGQAYLINDILNFFFHFLGQKVNKRDLEWVQLRRWLPRSILTYIAAMIPPSSSSVPDQLIWKWRASDKFSSKETFKNLYQVDSIGLSIQWNMKLELELECKNGLLVETILAGGVADSRMMELRLLVICLFVVGKFV
ncbi:hypothetical protein PVK06_020294 [Gossypium arboreum]|uniref:Reverse transcriptase n=1 Tax=Gossypium arboreum TaxID=29729 RepID=A0ABR0PLZ5_GOSAR|nr:hypothetical protein PVK06_020294 [Gossypium arboreum]